MNGRSFHRAISGIGRKPFSWYILWTFQILNTLWSTLCLWSPTSSPVLLHFMSFSLTEGALSASSHFTGLRGVMQGPGVFGSWERRKEEGRQLQNGDDQILQTTKVSLLTPGVLLWLGSHQENSEHRRNRENEARRLCKAKLNWNENEGEKMKYENGPANVRCCWRWGIHFWISG